MKRGPVTSYDCKIVLESIKYINSQTPEEKKLTAMKLYVILSLFVCVGLCLGQDINNLILTKLESVFNKQNELMDNIRGNV